MNIYFRARVQSVHHQQAYTISDSRVTRQSQCG